MSTLKVDTIRDNGSGFNDVVTFANSGGTENGRLCRAFVNFNGQNTVAIRASFNVNSISDNSQGDYTVIFSNAMADANYSAMVTVGTSATTDAVCPQTRTDLNSASGARVYMKGTTTAFFDATLLDVAIFR